MSLLSALIAKQQQLEREKYLMTPQYSAVSRMSSAYPSMQRQPENDIWEESRAADARAAASRADSEAYSEAKLREQQGRGIASTGDAYSDARLRDQLGLQPVGVTPSKPFENFLGSVTDQESYRPAIMQYIAAGGKRPKWFTGNYEIDKPNIEAAINATMTPQQQLIRQEAKQKSADLQEARQARIEMQREALTNRERESALKREGMQRKAAIPTRTDRLLAHDVLGGVLGDAYSTMPQATLDAIAARAAAGAKSKSGTDEAKGVDFEELLQDEVNGMIQRGELKLPQKGTGMRGFLGIGQPELPAEFKPQGTAPAQQQDGKIAPIKPVALKTIADYNSLPSGALYIHPSDGKTYRKK